ncbi:MAG: dTDP-glucose 4,6-dehydratase, partial [uncultured Solirubrobacteraceae bacterium]
EAAGVWRGRLHRLELRATARGRRRRRRGARQAHLRRAPGEPHGGRAPLRARRDRGSREGRRGDGRRRRGRELRRRDARRPLHRRARRVRAHPRPGHLRAARGRACARRALRAGLHRRGLRLDRRGLVHREVAAGPLEPVLGDEGRRRPSRELLLRHVRPRDADLPRLEQLRAEPAPGEAHPAHDPQRPARRQAPGLRRRAERPQLAVRRGLRARDRPRARARRARGGLQRRRPRRGDQHHGRTTHHRVRRREPRRAHRLRHRPPRPRPPLLTQLGEGARSGLGGAGALRRGPGADRGLVPRQPGVVGTDPLGRLPRLLRAPVRDAAGL